MSDKFDLNHELCKKYPLLYSVSGEMKRWGIAVGDGWYPLLNALSEAIYPEIERMEKEGTTCVCGKEKQIHPIPGQCGDFQARHTTTMQVKSKFKGLRFYVNFAPQWMIDLISKAEYDSMFICEWCGARLKSYTDGDYLEAVPCDICK